MIGLVPVLYKYRYRGVYLSQHLKVLDLVMDEWIRLLAAHELGRKNGVSSFSQVMLQRLTNVPNIELY